MLEGLVQNDYPLTLRHVLERMRRGLGGGEVVTLVEPGKTSVKRMSAAYPNAKLIRLPVHASWLNQIEIYFSIVQRKALTPTTSRRSPNRPGT